MCVQCAFGWCAEHSWVDRGPRAVPASPWSGHNGQSPVAKETPWWDPGLSHHFVVFGPWTTSFCFGLWLWLTLVNVEHIPVEIFGWVWQLLFASSSPVFDHMWHIFRWFRSSDWPENVVGNRISASGDCFPNIELSALCDLRRLWNLSPMLPHLPCGGLSWRQPVSFLSSLKFIRIMLPIGSMLQHVFLSFRFGVYIPKFLREITQDSAGIYLSINDEKILWNSKDTVCSDTFAFLSIWLEKAHNWNQPEWKD